jgi:hypothetical protein
MPSEYSRRQAVASCNGLIRLDSFQVNPSRLACLGMAKGLPCTLDENLCKLVTAEAAHLLEVAAQLGSRLLENDLRVLR